MLDIGFMEIFVIGALALIVVGPKDLPGLLRTVGQFVAKARGMAREFQRTMEDAAREADLGDVADVVKGGGNLNKLPFDNQIVDSMKEFERSVKAGVDDAKTEFDKPAETAKVEAPAAPETSKAAPAKSTSTKTASAKSTSTKTAATKTTAAKAPAAEKTAAKKPAAKKATSAKPSTAKSSAAKAKPAAKPAAKPKAAPKPKAAAKPKTTPEKSA